MFSPGSWSIHLDVLSFKHIRNSSEGKGVKLAEKDHNETTFNRQRKGGDMKRFKKKPLVITLIAIAAAVGISAGVVLAQDEDNPQPEAQHEALLEKVCEIYEDNTGVAIEPEALQDALIQAREEIAAQAREDHLDKLVEEGVITQEEADQLEDWWEARPDTALSPGPFFRDGPGGPQMGGFGPHQCLPGGQWGPGGDTEDTTTQ
jgi:hypothetical protein